MARSRTKKEYGRFKVVSSRNSRGLSSRTEWSVEMQGEAPVPVGSGKNGKKLARTLAATLASAGVHGFECLPPGFEDGDRPSRVGSGGEWEEWAAESHAVPAEIAAAGKAALAGWLKVVHRRSASQIAHRLGVSESTAQQYLSDLRQGRR